MKKLFILSGLAAGLFFQGCKTVQKTGPSVQSQPDTTEKVDSVLAQTPLVSDTLLDTKDIEDFTLEVWIEEKDTLSIIGVGDMMLGTNFPNEGYLPPNEGRALLADVHRILQNADITFGNLEGVMLDSGGTQKTCQNPDLCYLFRSPERYIQRFVEAGFDMVSLANNHAGDFGNEGRNRTMRVVEEAGIAHAGQLAQPTCVVTHEGVRYGMVAFSPNSGTVSIHDIENAKRLVQQLDSISDIIIVSFHGGAEGSKFQHVKRTSEMFYGENRGNVYEFAHAMIDAGADIIFGHGPHVTRSIDLYKDRFIIYSLGNFCTYARFNLRGENGIAPIIKVYTDREGKFLKGHITPIIQYGEGGVSIDANNGAIKTLQKLLKEDFPEVPLDIDEGGNITYIHAE
ncbi:CapA family protein [Cytophagales bacterium LB-30]|uniref:CapA family protein n=1 Tax=Shiella aurantiaca TaxID=3058365 RepID=A0ABT8F1S3_9BACT|nr:CapA family protein [Shiella aurantiaca]MDN4164400.1 CapA family protein [Shiella aurantiaca]